MTIHPYINRLLLAIVAATATAIIFQKIGIVGFAAGWMTAVVYFGIVYYPSNESSL